MFRSDFPDDDRHSHLPDDPADELWQESFCFVWHDPATSSGGNHHFSLWRNQKIADIWSWLVIDGKEVGREQVNDTAIPDGDITDFQVGGMRVTSHGDFAGYTMQHTYPGAQVTLRYHAYSPPVELDYARGGASLGNRHYETLGRVEVTVRVGDRTRELTGIAFQDHSWGHRELGRNPAGQFFFAVFGPDLMTSVYLRQTVTGQDQDGWVYRDGQLERVMRASIEAVIGNDGLLPAGSTCDLWTDTGGLRIGSKFQAGAVEGGIGLLAGDGLMIFECGGRLGGGMLELKPLRFALPEHRRILNLPD